MWSVQSVFDIGVPWVEKRGYRTGIFSGRRVGPGWEILTGGPASSLCYFTLSLGKGSCMGV